MKKPWIQVIVSIGGRDWVRDFTSPATAWRWAKSKENDGATITLAVGNAKFNLGPKVIVTRLLKEAQDHLATWDDDSQQFPRLLAEIHAIGLKPEQYLYLKEHMNLPTQDIEALFERAETAWEKLKAKHCPPRKG